MVNMTETRALPVSPYPLHPDQLAALKAAKSELVLNYLIQPVRPEPLPPTPILAFETPDVIGAYAYIREHWTVDNVKAALYAVLEQPGHPAIRQPAQQLSDILGCEVKEVEGESRKLPAFQ